VPLRVVNVTCKDFEAYCVRRRNVFPVRYRLNFYILFRTRRGGCSSTSTVASRVVRGNEKRNPVPWRYNWSILFLGECKYADLILQVERVSNLRQ
jgi:hypothetical protein